MKTFLRKFLSDSGYYAHFKYSFVFRIYETLFKPEVKKQQKHEVNFYQSFLPSTNLIFDIGGYDGHKTEAFLHLAEKVVCCEPDPTNFSMLKTRFRNKRKRVFLENIALGAKEGIAKMYLHHEASAFNTLNEKFKNVTEKDNMEKWNEKIQFQKTVSVTTTTLDCLMRKYGHPYFIKIDVEGYEQEVLKGLYHPVPFVSIECLLPDFREELQENLLLFLKLDANALFNIAIHEKLIFRQFLNYAETVNFLQQFDQHHFELVVRMKA